MKIHKLKLQDAQIPVWRDMSPVILLHGGAGGGKSFVCAHKMHALMLKYPGSTGLILRKTRESMTNSTLLLLEREVIRNHFMVSHKEQKHRFEYRNGSILAYGGMKDEAQREQIRSVGQKGALDFCWMEEANKFDEEDFNEVLARMRGSSAPWRQVMLSTNPDAYLHWINQRLIIGGEASCHTSYAKDNEYLDEQYLDTLQSLTGVQRDRLDRGMWVQSEGVVYDTFGKENIIDSAMDFKYYKRFFAGADSNFPEPRAGVILGITVDGEIHVIDEFYRESAHVEELAQWFGQFARDRKNQLLVFHDPSDPSAIQKIAAQPNVHCEKANNSVIYGINEVHRLMTSRTLKIVGHCKHLIGTLQSYSWKNNRRDVPEKKDDHLPDALRYALASIDLKPSGTMGGFLKR